MRQRVLSVLGVLLLALAVAAPATASQRPERFPSESGPADFPAGSTCSFAVRWQPLEDHSTIAVFPVQPNGDQVTRITGRYVNRVINLDTGAFEDYVANARLDIVSHADGTFDIHAKGPVLAAYGSADLTGPGMFYFVGNLHDELDENFTVLAHSFSGTAEDICETLSD